MMCNNKICGVELLGDSVFCHICGKRQDTEKDRRSKRYAGDGTYCNRADGRIEFKITLGTGDRKSFYGKTKKEARQKYYDFVAGEENKTESIETVGAWAEKWLEIYKKGKVAYGTYKNYELYVIKHIVPGLGSLKLDKVRPAHIADFMSKKSGLSESAQKHMIIALKAIFNTAIENKYCSENPVKRTAASKRVKEDTTKVFTVAQIDCMLKDAKTHRYSAYILFPLYTGMRMGELLALKWGDIDLKAGVITVRAATARGEKGRIEKSTKGGNVRTIGIPPKFKTALRKMSKEGEYVFCAKNGKPISPNTFDRRYKAFFEETGNYYLSAHKCRHTYGTYLLRGGVDLRGVQTALGHSSSAVTEKYTHKNVNDAKSSVIKLGY